MTAQDGDTATATLTITVFDTAPTAANDFNSAVERGPSITGNIALNDDWADGATLTSINGFLPGQAITGLYGTLIVNPNGTYTYTPSPFTNIVGGEQDVFTYTITDQDGDTATATLTISLQDTAPIARPDAGDATESGPISGNILLNDTLADGAILTSVAGAQPGTPINGLYGTLVVQPNGQYIYTPNTTAPAQGSQDVFTYTITDQDGDTSTSTLTITFPSQGNQPPVANPDTASTQIDTPLQFQPGQLLGNDNDPDGDPLSITGVSNPSNGTVVLNPDGTITFTPDPEFTGTASFDYTISDGNGGTSTTTVTVTVDELPILPTISIDNVTVNETDGLATFTVTLSNASTQPITVDYATEDNSATSGSDYIPQSGTLTFAPGTTTQTITVPIVIDTVSEPTENFYVNLSNPTNATIADSQGTGTIQDATGLTLAIRDRKSVV